MSYEVEASALAYDGALSRVRVDRVRMPDGSSAEREVIEHPDAVAIVCVDRDGDVILLRQYRHPLRTYALEIPAGKLDEVGETREDTARRELAEEVGLAAGTLFELVTFHNSAGWTDEQTTIYLATELEPVDTQGFAAEAEEADMEVVRMPLAKAVALARAGHISDAKTLIGLLLAEGVDR